MVISQDTEKIGQVQSALGIIAATAWLVLAGCIGTAVADTPSPAPRTSTGLALTPPTGWNSWNRFGCNIDEKVIRAAADAMVVSGMKDAGYQYVIIDDCWEGQRDLHGDIQPDPVRFPSGIEALAVYIHAIGLKFGLYSDVGDKTCAQRLGSLGHEYQDAAQYAAWGVDYLKYDWCNAGTTDANAAYSLMSDALRSTGRPIVFSLCDKGKAKPWLWATGIGNLWRTSSDIYDGWTSKNERRPGINGMIETLDQQANLWPFAGPGHWNDPDMLEIGNGGMTDREYRSEFSLWAMLAAPLIAGNDLTAMRPEIRAILTNREVIAVDQDPLGQQARRVTKDGDYEVWARPLKGGRRAVALLNRSGASHEMRVDWEALDYPAHLTAAVRDLWAGKDLPSATGSVSLDVPSHGVAMLLIAPP